MILGYYYHIPFISYDGKIRVPSFFGLFINELALNVERINLFLYERCSSDLLYFDYILESENIEVIKISYERKAFIKYFLADFHIKKLNKYILMCDFILLRGPSPSSYVFKNYIEKNKIINLVVGDYFEGIKFLKQPWFRLIPVIILNILMHKSYLNSLRNTYLVFNSELLRMKYFKLGRDSIMMNTGIISENDLNIHELSNVKRIKKIKLLYVGRLDWAKGFKELFAALSLLNESAVNINFTLDIVGSDDSSGNRIYNELIAASDNIRDFVVFHGSVSFVNGLSDFYKNSDILVLPSYQEGFPRVIWEALAYGVPVVTTEVGSIPYILTNEKTGLLVKPRNVGMLVDAILKISTNDKLYNLIRINGYNLVKENTLESQTKLLLNWIEKINVYSSKTI